MVARVGQARQAKGVAIARANATAKGIAIGVAIGVAS